MISSDPFGDDHLLNTIRNRKPEQRLSLLRRERTYDSVHRTSSATRTIMCVADRQMDMWSKLRRNSETRRCRVSFPKDRVSSLN
jgi:hypothetical protein